MCLSENVDNVRLTGREKQQKKRKGKIVDKYFLVVQLKEGIPGEDLFFFFQPSFRYPDRDCVFSAKVGRWLKKEKCKVRRSLENAMSLLVFISKKINK